MSTRRGGLGRGLGALLPTSPPPDRGPLAAVADEARSVGSDAGGSASRDDSEALTPVAGARLAEVAVSAVETNPQQPRQVFDEEALDELAASIGEVGILQPIVVRHIGPERYQLVMGERRWRAAQRAGLETMPAIVRETDDTAMLRDALLENLHRQQLNPLEEAAAYQQLLEEFGATHEELAHRIGKSRPQISNTLRLLHLPASVQKRVAAGVLSAGHARALLALDDSDTQDRLAHRIVAEGLSVRAVEEIVAMGVDTAAAPKQRARRAKAHAPALADLATRLSDRFETRVKVELGRSKGKIVVEFASLDDLERIVATMTSGELDAADDAAGSLSAAPDEPGSGAGD